ncbi:hypothetical protein SADUNF_Sadunf01G0149500 [Salix dunnii]|uniref:Uncharacterized protein n=1 Tax=Salix dunnii TaxID=1413687 RepID=A0A835NBZ8_9ROSI|nr:hypothetical protein SADUNF_Sadunf01G0149500 [Salix dunnii]
MIIVEHFITVQFFYLQFLWESVWIIVGKISSEGLENNIKASSYNSWSKVFNLDGVNKISKKNSHRENNCIFLLLIGNEVGKAK